MPKVWLSSTVMTPSLPTLSIASEIIWPISSSAAEIDATWAIWSFESTSFASCLMLSTAAATPASMPFFRVIGFGAGGDVAQALADHRPGEDGRGRRAVTGDVVGLLRDFLDQLGADALVGVLEVDLLRDRTRRRS
jgi:hypothetical protein